MLAPAVLFLLCADPSGNLLAAGSRGQTTQVEPLLNSGAKLEAKDKRGRTPLILAAQHGHADTVRLLLSKGADAEARDRDGWTAYGLILLSPAGDLFRKHQAEVLSLLPKPPRWRLAVDATWSSEAVFSSCFLGRDQLLKHVQELRLDDLAAAAFQSTANTSGDELVDIVQGGADADAVLALVVKPSASCAQQSGDNLTLSIEVSMLRAKDRTSLLKNTVGGGLKGLHARAVSNPSQYAALYDGWIKTHSSQIYHNVLAELLKSTR